MRRKSTPFHPTLGVVSQGPTHSGAGREEFVGSVHLSGLSFLTDLTWAESLKGRNSESNEKTFHLDYSGRTEVEVPETSKFVSFFTLSSNNV